MLYLEPLEPRRLLSVYTASPGDNLQPLVAGLQPGDTLNIQPGTYAGFSVFGLNGTAAQPITITGGDGVNIASRAPAESQLDVGVELSGFDAGSGCSYIDLCGIHVTDSSGTIKGALSAGFRVRFSHDITLTDCSAANCGWVGIYAAQVSHVLIDGCESVNNNLYVDSSTQRNHGIYIAQGSSDVTIRDCVVSGNQGNGIHANGDGGVNTGFIIENNTISGSGQLGGSAINCDGLQNSLIQGNLLTGNLNKGISLYRIDATGPSKGDRIIGNTVIMPPNARNAAVQIKDGAVNATVQGNRIVSEAAGVLVDFYNDSLPASFDHNVYFSPAAKPFSGDGSLQSFTAWRGNYPFDADSVMTVRGDTNLDGRVTGDDYPVIDLNLGRKGTDWLSGDTNGDAITSGDDYAVVDLNLGTAPVIVPLAIERAVEKLL